MAEVTQEIEKLGEEHRREIQEQKENKHHFMELLSASEAEKNKLMNEIASITLGQAKDQLIEMTKTELLTLINKLFYRIKDLEVEKTQYLKTFSKQKEESLSKYQRLLGDVKEARDKNRLNASHY